MNIRIQQQNVPQRDLDRARIARLSIAGVIIAGIMLIGVTTPTDQSIEVANVSQAPATVEAGQDGPSGYYADLFSAHAGTTAPQREIF